MDFIDKTKIIINSLIRQFAKYIVLLKTTVAINLISF